MGAVGVRPVVRRRFRRRCTSEGVAQIDADDGLVVRGQRGRIIGRQRLVDLFGTASALDDAEGFGKCVADPRPAAPSPRLEAPAAEEGVRPLVAAAQSPLPVFVQDVVVDGLRRMKLLHGSRIAPLLPDRGPRPPIGRSIGTDRAFALPSHVGVSFSVGSCRPEGRRVAREERTESAAPLLQGWP
jgi:hypothetical protein